MFLAEPRERTSKDGMSLIDYESQKDYTDCALHNRGGIVFSHAMSWLMPVSPWIMDGHIWWSSKHSHEK